MARHLHFVTPASLGIVAAEIEGAGAKWTLNEVDGAKRLSAVAFRVGWTCDAQTPAEDRAS